MTFSDALKIALRKSSYFHKKYYVWGFQGRRGKWYYTVTDYQPGFMFYSKHIT